jgi:undecaprenyl-diphosphatase
MSFPPPVLLLKDQVQNHRQTFLKGSQQMSLIKIIILAVVQGAAELLPVSSSAHVIVVEKLMGLDPASPEMTILLVMLHTGTMFAVISYFWTYWKSNFFSSRPVFWIFARLVIVATVFTGLVGLALKFAIEKIVLRDIHQAEVELLFGNLPLIAAALAAAGVLIIYAGGREKRFHQKSLLGFKASSWIGAVQGLCLPFRGFSRSGATISTGLLLGLAKARAEAFSFALVVVLTPPVILREVLRLLKAQALSGLSKASLVSLFFPSLLGMVLSFVSGLLALRWLSRWLEQGRWQLFGIYCLGFAVVVLSLYKMGF